jgi:hypothetical protein
MAINMVVNKVRNFHLNFNTAYTLAKGISSCTKNPHWLKSLTQNTKIFFGADMIILLPY